MISSLLSKRTQHGDSGSIQWQDDTTSVYSFTDAMLVGSLSSGKVIFCVSAFNSLSQMRILSVGFHSLSVSVSLCLSIPLSISHTNILISLLTHNKAQHRDANDKRAEQEGYLMQLADASQAVYALVASLASTPVSHSYSTVWLDPASG